MLFNVQDFVTYCCRLQITGGGPRPKATILAEYVVDGRGYSCDSARGPYDGVCNAVVDFEGVRFRGEIIMRLAFDFSRVFVRLPRRTDYRVVVRRGIPPRVVNPYKRFFGMLTLRLVLALMRASVICVYHRDAHSALCSSQCW